MKQRRSKIGSIIGSTAVVIFSLAAAFSGSFAWFEARRSLSVNSGDFEVRDLGKNVSNITFHELNEIVDGKYTFNTSPDATITINQQTQEITQVGTPVMPSYSLDYPHQPVLILLTVNSGSGDATISVHNESVYIADPEPGQGKTPYNMAQHDEHPLSSVAKFIAFTYTTEKNQNQETIHNIYIDEEIVSQNVSSPYAIPTAALDNSTEWCSFVEMENGEFTSFSPRKNVYAGTTDYVTYIGIVVDYYSESLEYIYSYYMGSSYTDSALAFYCDWGMDL